MKQLRLMWDMPITVEIADSTAVAADIGSIYDYFAKIDRVFSVFRDDSEITAINKGKIKPRDYSPEMTEVMELSQKTKTETGGYFDIGIVGRLDPLGLVKGWAVRNASLMLQKIGYQNFYIDAGGDIEVHGLNPERKPWTIGIRNPQNRRQNIKVLKLHNLGIATSGTYIRGDHIINPFNGRPATDWTSFTVIGPDVFEADRFATAAMAMGRPGINFIAGLPGFAAYAVDAAGVATYTPEFTKFIA